MKLRQANKSLDTSKEGADLASASPAIDAGNSNSAALDALNTEMSTPAPTPSLAAAAGELEEAGPESLEAGAEFGAGGYSSAAPGGGADDDGDDPEIMALVREYAAKLGISSLPRISLGKEALAKTAKIGASGLYEAGVIYLNPSTFDPSSREGRQTLAHEMTHAAQDLNAFEGESSGAAAEVEAHTMGAELAEGKAVDGPSAFLPGDHVAAEGASTQLSDMVNQLNTSIEPMLAATEATADGLDAKGVSGDAPQKDTKRRAKDWRKGSKRTMKGLLDTKPAGRMIKKVDKGEPYGGDLSEVKSTEQYGDLIDMYKATIEDEDDGPALQSVWESKIANTGWRKRTKRTSRIIADEVKKEAKLSAEEEAAAAEAREASGMTAPEAEIHEASGEADLPSDASGLTPATLDIQPGDLEAASVSPEPMATPNWDAVKSLDGGSRPDQEGLAESMSMSSVLSEGLEAEAPEIGNRYLYTLGEIGGGILDGGVAGLKKGALDGVKKQTVGKLTDKLEESIDGALNKKLGKHLGTDGFEFVQGGKAGFDLLSSMYEHGSIAGPLIDLQSAVTEKAMEAGADWERLTGYFGEEGKEMWANASGVERTGIVLAAIGDALGLAINVIGIATEALSKIGTILWGVGFALIIIGLILLFWTGGASAALIKGGKAVIKFAKLLAKFQKVLSKVSSALKPFKFLFDTAAAFMVPDEMLAAQTDKSKAGASEIAEETSKAVSSKVTEDATKFAVTQAQRPFERETPATKDRAAEGEQEAQERLEEGRQEAIEGLEQVEQAAEDAKAEEDEKKKGWRERARDAGAATLSYSREVGEVGLKEFKSQLDLTQVTDVRDEWTGFRDELRAFTDPEDAVARRGELSDRSKKLGDDLSEVDKSIEQAKREVQELQDEINGISGPGSTGDGSTLQQAQAEVDLAAAQERLAQFEATGSTLREQKKAVDDRVKGIDQYYIQEVADRDRMEEIHQENVDFAAEQMWDVHEADDTGFQDAYRNYVATYEESAWSSSFMERQANPDEFTQKEIKSSKSLKDLPGGVVGLFSGSDEEESSEEAQLDEASEKGLDTAIEGAEEGFSTIRWMRDILEIESPVEDINDIDEVYNEAAENIEAFHNEHAAAYRAYAAEIIISGEIEQNMALEEGVIKPAEGAVESLGGPVAEAESNASQRAAVLGGAQAPTEEADPELIAGTKDSMSNMEDGKDDMSKSPDSGDVAGGAEGASSAQDASNELAEQGASEGEEAASEQVEIMTTVSSTRDEAEQEIHESEAALLGKVSEDHSRLAEVRSVKANHLAAMNDHHGKGEAAAAEYGSKLATGAEWASSFDELRE